MLFNSYVFLFAFLPASLAGFFIAGRFGRAAAGAWLVVASFVFYGWWNPAFCLLLGLSIVFNYSVSVLIARTQQRPTLSAWVLGIGIAANLAAMIYYKYLAWLTELLNASGIAHLPVPNIVLPLGISFFTFTQIGYLIDCALGVARDRDPLNYLLFVTFFPHLIAGPILHNQDIMPQFAEAKTHRFSLPNVAVGSGIFTAGLLKKCLLADPLSPFVGASFSHPHDLPMGAAWQAALSYSLQLYFDFSGYSDMAIGLARMFNITFPLNFNSPYKSRSVIDYWQRWHMTLTRYLTQYVYTPIAVWVMRSRRGRRLAINRAAQRTAAGFGTMIAFPITATMALAGIWHGSGTQFLIFGLLHAFYLCVNHAWRIFMHEPRSREAAPAWRIGRVVLTYLCVLVGAVFFRAPSVEAALSLLGGMAGLHGGVPGLPVPDALLRGPVAAFLAAQGLVHAAGLQAVAETALAAGHLVVLYVIVWALPNTQQIFIHYAPALQAVTPGPFRRLTWRMTLPWAVTLGCAAMLGVLSLGGTSEFLYFQF